MTSLDRIRSRDRLASFCLLASIVGTPLILTGCNPAKEPLPMVVATTWAPEARAEVEAAVARESGDQRPIRWIVLATGEKFASVVDRRGGVDLILGGSAAKFARLSESGHLRLAENSKWLTVRRPKRVEPDSAELRTDPRVDPIALSVARSTLQIQGWAKGYESLVRRSSWAGPMGIRSDDRSIEVDLLEYAALSRSGRSPDRARRFLQSLETLGIAKAVPAPGSVDRLADELLADLLGAAIVDAAEERRDALAALDRFGHPEVAEGSIGERPPWPPASVVKLRGASNGPSMVETLAEQVAPDPESRAWLESSWLRPKRPIDGAWLNELARAADGRLAREPRFRAWLRSEWTAWNRQLYRRVARLAGGYVPI